MVKVNQAEGPALQQQVRGMFVEQLVEVNLFNHSLLGDACTEIYRSSKLELTAWCSCPSVKS